MLSKTSFIIFICLSITTNIYSQDSIILSSKDNSFNRITVSFGGLTQGEIIIKDHLTDSLSLTNPKFNSMLRVNSFHMTIMCNGQVMKSIDNKSGNKLTDEMKVAINKVHPGCSIIFGSIELISLKRDIHDKYNTLNYGSSLSLIIK